MSLPGDPVSTPGPTTALTAAEISRRQSGWIFSLHTTALKGAEISRRFGAVVALAAASISLAKGEVLGLVGDNGAGKSTLIKIISGVLTPDAGRIVLDGGELNFKGPGDALDR